MSQIGAKITQFRNEKESAIMEEKLDKSIESEHHRFCVAPMMDWSDNTI
jgi:tRNA-dihydrouridine synthase